MADVIAKHICDLYKADVIAFVADVIAINLPSQLFLADVIAKMSWCYVITNCFSFG